MWIPTDEDFFLSLTERTLPARDRALLVLEAHAFFLTTQTDGTVARVVYAIRYLVPAARVGGRRWDRAWDRACRELRGLTISDMTYRDKATFYLHARGQL